MTATSNPAGSTHVEPASARSGNPAAQHSVAPVEFQRFADLTRKLTKVRKAELDAKLKKR